MLASILFVAALLMLLGAIIGLVQPSRVNLKNRKQAAQAFAGALLLAVVSLAISPSSPKPNPAQVPITTTGPSGPEKALAELDRKKSELAAREQAAAVMAERVNALTMDLTKLKGVRLAKAGAEQRLGVVIEPMPAADKGTLLSSACERIRAADLSALNGRWAYVAIRSAGDGKYHACPPAHIPDPLMQAVANHPLVIDIADGNPARQSSDLDVFADLPDWQYNMPDAERKRLEYEEIRLRLASDLCRAASQSGAKVGRIGIVRADSAPPQGIRDHFRHQRIPCQ